MAKVRIRSRYLGSVYREALVAGVEGQMVCQSINRQVKDDNLWVKHMALVQVRQKTGFDLDDQEDVREVGRWVTHESSDYSLGTNAVEALTG
jgi:hypothetical protein